MFCGYYARHSSAAGDRSRGINLLKHTAMDAAAPLQDDFGDRQNRNCNRSPGRELTQAKTAAWIASVRPLP
jgi:hypothetical protein